jgi:hypothetical protein
MGRAALLTEVFWTTGQTRASIALAPLAALLRNPVNFFPTAATAPQYPFENYWREIGSP